MRDRAGMRRGGLRAALSAKRMSRHGGQVRIGPVNAPEASDHICRRIDIEEVTQAGIIGVFAALAYDIGIAAAGGERLTPRIIFGDIATGGAGGVTTETLRQLGANEVVAAFAGSFVTGFFFQLLFPPDPASPRPVGAEPVEVTPA